MIPIKNIYYMLSYAFDLLKADGYKNLETEKFENTADLFSAILILGTNHLLKRGLGREYISYKEPLSSLKGKINITESIKKQTMINHKLVCEYDDYSFDCEKNQILKTSLYHLTKLDITTSHKKEINRLIQYFKDVSYIDLNLVNWNKNYDRNNKDYQLLIAICYFVKKGLIQKSEDGDVKMKNFINEKTLYHLYEKFLLAFFKKECPWLKSSSPQIKWQLDNDYSENLPVMQSDIVLENESKILIIDAKFYTDILKGKYNSKKVNSEHLYQILAYVKNKQIETEKTVAGMLLYAKTEKCDDIDYRYSMSGNEIYIRTLDLNKDFASIKNCLIGIANSLGD